MTDHQQPTDDGPGDAPWEANFAANVRERRLSLRMTQTDLAKAAKTYGLPFHQPTIQRIEKGERPIRLNEALILSEVLRSPLNRMLIPSETEAEVALAIDEAIYNARSIAKYLHGAALDWAGTAVYQLVQVAEAKIDADKAFADQSPVAKLVLIWIAKILDIYRVLDSAYERTTRMSPGDGSKRLDEIEGFPSHFITRLREIYDRHLSEDFASLILLPMRELVVQLDLPDPWKTRFGRRDPGQAGTKEEDADGER